MEMKCFFLFSLALGSAGEKERAPGSKQSTNQMSKGAKRQQNFTPECEYDNESGGPIRPS
jgi:hypothetical protein